jgi:hypothetical protein
MRTIVALLATVLATGSAAAAETPPAVQPYSVNAAYANWGKYKATNYQFVAAQVDLLAHRAFVQVTYRRGSGHAARVYSGETHGRSVHVRFEPNLVGATVRARVGLKCRTAANRACRGEPHALVVATFYDAGRMTWMAGESSELIGRLVSAKARVAGHSLGKAYYAELGHQTSTSNKE